MTQKNIKDFLNQKVSFFTGSLVLITALTIALSVIPNYKEDHSSALEVILTTFVESDELYRANIESDKFKIEIYRKALQRALQIKDAPEEVLEEEVLLETEPLLEI